MERFDEESYVLKDTAARFQDGTQNVAGLAALHASLHELNALGMDAVQEKNLALLAGIKAVLREHGIDFIDHGTRQSNIVSLRAADPAALTAYLQERNVYIKVIEDVARMSFIHESTLEEAEVLARHTRDFLDRARS
jgi:selenocysteine lyase/cysteine desulfurase